MSKLRRKMSWSLALASLFAFGAAPKMAKAETVKDEPAIETVNETSALGSKDVAVKQDAVVEQPVSVEPVETSLEQPTVEPEVENKAVTTDTNQQNAPPAKDASNTDTKQEVDAKEALGSKSDAETKGSGEDLTTVKAETLPEVKLDQARYDALLASGRVVRLNEDQISQVTAEYTTGSGQPLQLVGPTSRLTLLQYKFGDGPVTRDYVWVLKINGEYVFCVEPLTDILAGDLYTGKENDADIDLPNNDNRSNAVYRYGTTPFKLSRDKVKEISRLVSYARDNGELNTYLNYAYLQSYIWESGGATITGFLNQGASIEGMRSYIADLNARSAINAKANFDQTDLTVQRGSSVTVTDSNNVLPNLRIPTVTGVTFTRNGNQLTITVAKDAPLGSNVVDFKGELIKYRPNILYTKSGRQTLASMSASDPQSGLLNLNIAEEPKGELRIVKRSSQTGNPVLEGAVFRVTGPNGFTQEVTTDKNGEFVISNLAVGDYTVTELKAPNGYVLTATVTQNASVKQNERAGVTFVNPPQEGRITVVKNNEKGTGLANAVFEVFNQANQLVDTLTTAQNGRAQSKLLALGDYRVVEKSAPNGYILNVTPQTVSLTYAGQTVPVVEKTVTFVNKEQKGRVVINKTTTGEPNVKVDGARFEIRQNGQVVDTLTTDSNGFASSKELALGTYQVVEVATKKGYVLDVTPKETNFVWNQKGAEVLTNTLAFENKRQKLVIRISKVSKDDKTPLAGVEFKVYQNGNVVDTLVTDAKGFAQSKTFNTSNVAYEVRETKSLRGWVLNPTPQSVLEIGDATTTEVLTRSLAFENDVEKPVVHTTAFDTVTLGHDVEPLAKVTIRDRVAIEKVIPNREYRVDGVLMDKATGQALMVDGKEVRQSLTFKATDYNMTVNLDFVLNASNLKGKDIVVFERLFYNNKEVGSHTDINDKNQTVRVTTPTIGTTATSKEDGGKLLNPVTTVTVVDAVTYRDLIVGKEYTVNGTLMLKSTGQALQYKGAPVKASKTFTATQANGTVSLEFTFDASALRGQEVVAFERMQQGNDVIAVHEDLTDEGQTVRVVEPKIGTKATSKEDGGKLINPIKTVTVTDAVSYTNLVVGKEYTVNGKLMVKSTGKVLMYNGKEVTASKTFVATQANGTVSLDFTFDASALRGKEIVAFERLSRGNDVIATHEDINDEGQTVRVTEPKIGTTATSKEDGGKLIDPITTVTVVDAVSYNNLIVGKEYTVKGRLMRKSTGEVLIYNGQPVVASKTFVATKSSGTISLEFTFDASQLRGEAIVAFERLSRGNDVIATHEDLNDEGQTVRVTEPKIGTTATSKKDGSKVVDPLSTVTVVDAVKYQNLIIGREYTVTGKLMRKSTGTVLEFNGQPVTATKTFVATQASGTIDLEFTFDATALKGEEVVAFERVSRGNDVVATHEDLEDKGQTVKVLNIEITTTAVFENGEKAVMPGTPVKIIDKVAFKNLNPNATYRLSGVLMDKSTEKPLLVDGKEVTGEVIFNAKDHQVEVNEDGSINGVVEVTFSIENTSGLVGKEVVVFEELDHVELDAEGKVVKAERVAEHKDINDEGQTVRFLVPPTPPHGPELPKTGEMNILPLSLGLLTLGISFVYVSKRKEA